MFRERDRRAMQSRFDLWFATTSADNRSKAFVELPHTVCERAHDLQREHRRLVNEKEEHPLIDDGDLGRFRATAVRLRCEWSISDISPKVPPVRW